MPILNSSNQKGLSLLAVVMSMMMLSAMGMAIVYLSGTAQTVRTNQSASDVAYFAAHAGLEYAEMQNRSNLALPNQVFQVGTGTFTVSQAGNTITSVGKDGTGKQVTLAASAPMMRDCLGVDTSQAHADAVGTQISGIYVRKLDNSFYCSNNDLTIFGFFMNWESDFGEKIIQVTLDGSPFAGPAGSGGWFQTFYSIPVVDVASKEYVITFDQPIKGKASWYLNIVMSDWSGRPSSFTPP